jgi:hypothetical protein
MQLNMVISCDKITIITTYHMYFANLPTIWLRHGKTNCTHLSSSFQSGSIVNGVGDSSLHTPYLITNSFTSISSLNNRLLIDFINY